MKTQAGIDWHAYNTAAAGRPARRMVQKAIAAAGGDASGRLALDLGAGGGADSLEFARRGWHVHAYDSDDTLVSRLVENSRLPGRIAFHHVDIADVPEFPRADVVYSAYALPMLGADLPAVWQRLRRSVSRGGVIAVDLFGERDTWAERPEIATLSASEIDALFEDFVIVDRTVRDEPGRSVAPGDDEKKHWHVISTIARRAR